MMKTISTLLVVVAVGAGTTLSYARGFGGGGGGGGGRIGGGGGGGGGMARPAPVSRPSPMPRPTPSARPSTPNLGSHPSHQMPQVNRPTTRPTSPSNVSRPNPGSMSGGGLKPGTSERPSTLPGNLNRPANKLPETRPSHPDLGGGSVSKLPGNVGNTRPNFPGTTGQTRPGFPGTTARPTPGSVGDFLGMDRPVNKLPEFNRPATRPNIATQPGVATRPININQGQIGSNNIINSRPSWVNINNNQVSVINNRWQGQINSLHGWDTRYPNRTGYWHGWADGVRASTNWHSYYHGCFGPNWWGAHYHPWCGWHYGWRFGAYNWNYWWTIPTYAALNSWFTWSAPQQVWSQPVYYDYGTGGNVVYNDNRVSVNGQEVGTASEFAQSAAALATVPPPPSEEAAKAAEWMPLGTFAVSRGEKDKQPNLVVQLAVNKEGIISGTLYDTASDKSQSVQGRVDKETQRVAIRVGENEKLVAETGIYNLTQQEAPVLVHYGEDKVENWLLVRMEAPADDEADAPAAQAQ